MAFSARAGEAMVRGVVSADLSGAVPQIKASLSGDRLDVDALARRKRQGARGVGASDGASGWSDAKIDFSGLKSVNAQLNLSVERSSYGTIKAGPIEHPRGGGWRQAQGRAAELPALWRRRHRRA